MLARMNIDRLFFSCEQIEEERPESVGLQEPSDRAIAAAESAVVIVFWTAFAPGICERAMILSFSRSERVDLLCSDSFVQPANSVSTAAVTTNPRFDMRPSVRLVG